MIRLASSPEPQRWPDGHAASGRPQAQHTVSEGGHRNIPVREPDPEPNPQPDVPVGDEPLYIAPADWDTLFNAVADRLEACSGPAPLGELPETAPGHGRGLTPDLQHTVRECVDAMHRLHAALPRDWHPHKRSH